MGRGAGKILNGLKLGSDGIYSYSFNNKDQEEEIRLRKKVASRDYQNYLDVISHSHSIPVMDKEVRTFLGSIPDNGDIIDVGGGWGWHWRDVELLRPDILVIIVDFIRENLQHAAKLLGNKINRNVFLVHGDALSLIFRDNTFDGYWSVQTLQHIPNFHKAVEEAYRVLKPGALFANYSLNEQSLISLIYGLFSKTYHISGTESGSFYLSRASEEQLSIVNDYFCNKAQKRFTEVLFKPELGIRFPGKERSISGKVDSCLSSNSALLSSIARQQSYHTTKPL
ncbi:MAG TPA: class I SAM-dependent methyltransferase [Candidatus Scalindua sp.]|nr:class I SAM-dependent methyltransferase [Candidatus Scalindua sp.]